MNEHGKKNFELSFIELNDFSDVPKPRRNYLLETVNKPWLWCLITAMAVTYSIAIILRGLAYAH